jgi:flagellar motor switch protein FliM
MTDILSQDEIDQLLSAISSGDAQQEDLSYSQRNERKVRIYDFKRPYFLTKKHIRAVRSIFEDYTRDLGLFLTELSSMNTKTYLQSIDQLTFEEFQRSIPNPCFITQIDMMPLKGQAFVNVDPEIYTILLNLQKDTPDVEENLSPENMDHLENLLLPINTGILRNTFSSLIDLRPLVNRNFKDPFQMNFIKQGTMTLLITIEVSIKVDEHKYREGFINIAIPENTLSKIKNKLSIEYLSGKEEKESKMLDLDISQAKIPCTIKFKSENKMYINDLQNLKIGDTIPLDSTELEIWC